MKFSILKELTELVESRFFGTVELQLENGRIVEVNKGSFKKHTCKAHLIAVRELSD